MNTHPLSLPEIILIVGKHIPVWVPTTRSQGAVLEFKPKDLLAAISVNRIFHRTLTPLLWTVYAIPAFKPFKYFVRSSETVFEYDNYDTDPDTLQKNSPYIRYLDLSLHYPKTDRSLDQFQLSCTRLQELELPPLGRSIDSSQSWPACSRGWKLNSVYLHHILDNNAQHLEELQLGKNTYLLKVPSMNAQWNGLKTSALSDLTDEQVAEASQLVEGRPLLLPKVKTLHLDIPWSKTSKATYNLVRAFPGLETLMIGHVHRAQAPRLSRNLREFCPQLRAVRTLDPGRELPWMSGETNGVVDDIPWIEACAPGRLAHFAMSIWTVNEELTNALLQHKDSLEILELFIRDEDLFDFVDYLEEILRQCMRLKQLSLCHDGILWDLEALPTLLDGLSTCQELESLALVGFPDSYDYYDDSNEDESEDEEDESEDEEDGEDEGETIGGIFYPVLPRGWRHVPRIDIGNDYGSTKKCRDMVFEVVNRLPAMETVVLNTCESVWKLLRAFPALESLIIQPTLEKDNLAGQQRLVNLIGACAPGRPINFRIGLMRTDDLTTATLLEHEENLEELVLSVFEWGDEDENVGRLNRMLKRCKRLKRFTLNCAEEGYTQKHGVQLLSERLACEELEVLILRSIETNDDELKEDDTHHYLLQKLGWNTEASIFHGQWTPC
ncbi:hypothetical protein BGX33_009540 [Mortierella sp. NVP41]|nr:hypothetical protein BGX33_009540 [Mortierella sp. NVP41]